MSYFKQSRGFNWAFWAGIVFLFWPTHAYTREFEFLYINASEGSASGGHAAVKFDNEVFHFQHLDPGILRIYRDDFSAFRLAYGFQENRAIHGHRIKVSDATFQSFRDAFNRRLIIQDQQIRRLKALNEDYRLLNDLKRLAALNPIPATFPSVQLKALGYFVSDFRLNRDNHAVRSDAYSKSTPIVRLKQAILDIYGKDFLKEKTQQTWKRLQGLKPEDFIKSFTVSETRFEPGRYSFSQQYTNLLLNLAALKILEQAAAPRSEALSTAASPQFLLNDEAVTKLDRFQQKLFSDLIKLTQSRRSDWGYPFLVGMARLHALELSINARQLVVLNRLRESRSDDQTLRIAPQHFSAIAKFADNGFNATIKRLSQSEIDEYQYGDLEVKAGALLQIKTSIQAKKSFPLPAADNTPSLAANAEPVRLPLTVTELDTSISRYKIESEAYSEKLQTLYRYELLNRNCVTEIFRVLNGDLAKQANEDGATNEAIEQTSQRLLGGYIENDNINIVPFLAFDQVASQYRLESSYRLPSYREQQIQRQYRSNTDVLVDLTESNTITSSLYQWHGTDAAFVFFTQDSIWLRPFMGGVNLAVAIGQTLYGLFALPLDTGENLQKSMKGIFVSVPELFFFNIRKGSFPHLLPPTIQNSDLAQG
ncbi:hypothetical protein [Methylomonas sp. MgM2]